MAELRNSLIYWGRSMEKYFMLMLVIPLATAVGMSVMSGEVDFEYILFYVPLIFSISILAIAFQNITAALSNISAMISSLRIISASHPGAKRSKNSITSSFFIYQLTLSFLTTFFLFLYFSMLVFFSIRFLVYFFIYFF